jgi:ABC-type polysaccharide/polyol phosphate export permease
MMYPQYKVAMADVLNGVAGWRMWGRMGWAEVKRRYRRTLIGPFWTSLSLIIFVGTMGFLYATLWHQPPQSYLPFLCSGMICWVLVSAIITEGCGTFTANSGLLTQMPFNYTTLACIIVWRNVITFLHNLVVYALLALPLGVPVTLDTLLFFPGLLLIALNGVWIANLLGMACARFRDIQQVVSSLLQVAMFVTPIFWSPEQLVGRGQIFTEINILYHLVDIVRAPLLGKAPAPLSYAVVLGLAVIGWATMLYLFSRFRRRVVFWL